MKYKEGDILYCKFGDIDKGIEFGRYYEIFEIFNSFIIMETDTGHRTFKYDDEYFLDPHQTKMKIRKDKLKKILR